MPKRTGGRTSIATATGVVQRLDLDRPRGLGALIVTAVRVWLAHFPVFFTLALVVVAPIALLVEGLWSRSLGDRDATFGVAPAIVWWLCTLLVVPSLVTAMHVAAVRELGAGRRPTVRGSAGAALRVFPHVLLVVSGYVLVTSMGLLLCVAPGVYLLVRWYFGVQAVVAAGRRGDGAFDLSEELVAGRWWWTLGALVAFALAGGLPTIALAWSLAGADSRAIVAAADIALNAAGVSFSALAGTLLFFSLRAKSSGDHS